MKFLVLGGNGYLGSKVIYRLVSDGETVISTKRAKSDMSRLSGLKKQITIIPASVDAVSTMLQYEKIDWVLNMACTYGRGNVLYDSVIESNIEFPLAVLNTAVEHGIRNFLTIGTGLPDELSMYSFSKKMYSEFGEFYVKKHNINFVNMKLEMFYGADEPGDRFIPGCIQKMIHNEPIELTEGTQHRDIVAVNDVVNAIIYAIRANLSGYWLVPVGTGEAPTIREVVEYIHSCIGSHSELKFGAVPMRPNEPDCCADTSVLENMGYYCKYSWKQGIQEMIREVRK